MKSGNRRTINIPVSKPFRPAAVRVILAILGVLLGMYFTFLEFQKIGTVPVASFESITASLGVLGGLAFSFASGTYLKRKFDQSFEIVLS